MRHALPFIALALLLTACGKDPDARSTAGEGQLTAKAVADVDGAMADARSAPPTPVQEAAPDPVDADAQLQKSK